MSLGTAAAVPDAHQIPLPVFNAFGEAAHLASVAGTAAIGLALLGLAAAVRSAPGLLPGWFGWLTAGVGVLLIPASVAGPVSMPVTWLWLLVLGTLLLRRPSLVACWARVGRFVRAGWIGSGIPVRWVIDMAAGEPPVPWAADAAAGRRYAVLAGLLWVVVAGAGSAGWGALAVAAGEPWWHVAVNAVVLVVPAAVGAALAARLPGNPVGAGRCWRRPRLPPPPVLLAGGLDSHPAAAAASWAAWADAVLWALGPPPPPLIALVFPDGRLWPGWPVGYPRRGVRDRGAGCRGVGGPAGPALGRVQFQPGSG